MTKFEIQLPFLTRLSFLLLLLCPACLQAAPADLLPSGFRPVPVGVHALVGAKVVVKPGEVIDPATIIIRDGYIEKVGKELSPPSDARVWDLKGLVIYAGFIDPYLALGAKSAGKGGKRDLELTGGGVKFFGVNPQERDAEPGG